MAKNQKTLEGKMTKNQKTLAENGQKFRRKNGEKSTNDGKKSDKKYWEENRTKNREKNRKEKCVKLFFPLNFFLSWALQTLKKKNPWKSAAGFKMEYETSRKKIVSLAS